MGNGHSAVKVESEFETTATTNNQTTNNNQTTSYNHIGNKSITGNNGPVNTNVIVGDPLKFPPSITEKSPGQSMAIQGNPEQSRQ